MEAPRHNAQTAVRFLGTATVTPGPGADTACVLLDRATLVDTGWNAAVNMLQYGCDPLDVDWLFITHCHHDHYIGLPQLLFYHGMKQRERPGKDPLTIVGPKPDLQLVVDRALAFLRGDQFPNVAKRPEVVPLQAGDRIETTHFTVETAPTIHPVVGLCYRFHSRRSGADVVITGDTARHLPLADHAEGADLLVHEASRGPVASSPNDRGGHAGAEDAADIAKTANVRRLALIHYPAQRRQETLRAAQSIFPNTCAPREGDTILLPEALNNP